MAGPATLTQQIIHDHLAAETNEEIARRVDRVLLEDATGTMACLQLEQLGLDHVVVLAGGPVAHAAHA